MKLTKCLVLLVLLFAITLTSSSEARSLSISFSTAATTAACPMDMNYVLRIPWNSSTCHGFHPIRSRNDTQKTDCCQCLLSLFGVGLAQHLKETTLFHLPDLVTSISCLEDFQSRLTSLSLPKNLVSLCLDPLQFVTTPNICAHIQSTKDWTNKLGHTTQLNTTCGSDLTEPAHCDACVEAGTKILANLTSIDGNYSHSKGCFYFTTLYIAGIVNEFGPQSNGVVTCILGIPVLVPLRSGSRGKYHQSLVFGLTGVSVALLLISSLLGLYFWGDRRWKRKKIATFHVDLDMEGLGSRQRFRSNAVPIWFKIEDLKMATNNFSSDNFIGQGGFGMVYKGNLSDGTTVAIKRLLESESEGDTEFCNEVEIICNLKHRNLVLLRGCCIVDDIENSNESGSQRFLVYDYMPNGKLYNHLFPSVEDNQSAKKSLTWPQRKSIILDVAKGLAYLHYGVKPAIYHRDIKAANILLDADMSARIADFGLAKQNIGSGTHLTTKVAGTHGYLAPEYALYGQLTEKSDVYSFGVLILEIVCGRKALQFRSSGTPAVLITDWAWSWVKSGNIEKAIDASLFDNGGCPNSNPKSTLERFLLVGILASHVAVVSRPTILDVLKMLEGDSEVPPIPDRPVPLEYPFFCNLSVTPE